MIYSDYCKDTTSHTNIEITQDCQRTLYRQDSLHKTKCWYV